VWGPKGAPGRTTVAVNLAFEALPSAGETLLVDADTYGGSISQTLGFIEDGPGLAWAARLASRGELDAPRIWQATRRAGAAGPRVLSGLPRADLWTEIRPGTWEALLDLFRLSFQLTIVDVGFCLEEEEELLYDHVRFRRNAVTRLALQRADQVIAVARADPVGLHDFVRGYQQLRELGVEPSRIRIVVNQVRGGLFGGDAPVQIKAALGRYLGLEPSIFVPYDRAAVDAALMLGKALREVRPGTGVRQAIVALAASVVGTPQTVPQGRRFRRRGRRRRGVVWNGRPSGPTMTSRNLGW
jgi:MinD-like ATPase involved in chromosome partitioning or flagellar assembly